MKRIISIFTVILMAFSCNAIFASCSSGRKASYDETKTPLFVGNYNGGVGDAWLYDVEKRFEEKYANYVKGDKVGVDVVIDSDKDCLGKSLINTLSADPNEVYFTQQVNYFDYAARGIIRDITGLVNKQNPDDGNKSIYSKL